jgi:hypothetical protein
MYHELKVHGFALDPLTKSPVVILKDREEGDSVLVWISSADAVAMATELVARSVAGEAGEQHLLNLLLERLEMELDRLLLEAAPGGGYTATVICSAPDGELDLEVRLLDLLLLAIRNDLPLQVDGEIVARSSDGLLAEGELSELDAGRFADFLEKLDPADMGKYPI